MLSPASRQRIRTGVLGVCLFCACSGNQSTPPGESSGGAHTVAGGGTPALAGAPPIGGSSTPQAGATALGGAGADVAGAAGSSGALAAAGSIPSPPSGAGSGGASGAAGSPVLPSAGAQGVDRSAEIYDPEKLVRFDIELPGASVAALNAITGADDPRQDEYVRATLRYGTESVADVGLRIKGEGSFRKLDRKTALKLKFDEYVNNQAFRGLRRLTLNNMVEDPSFLAERLAYEFFRAVGLPAPRCNSALVYVNGEFYGVYANVEAEDKTFLRRWFTSDEGNLYEEGQVDFTPGAETAFDLETNETANDRSDLRDLIAAIQSATPATFVAAVGGHLDVTHFLRFTAAEAAVNQWDMYSYTVFYPNNFRIYRDPEAQKFVFLPWGMDMSMKPFRDSGKPHIGVFELARQGDRAGGRVSAGLLFTKCLESAACKASYTEAVSEIADAYEEADLAAAAARYYEQIKAEVYADPRKEYTNARFEQGYETLLKTIGERPGALRRDLAP